MTPAGMGSLTKASAPWPPRFRPASDYAAARAVDKNRRMKMRALDHIVLCVNDVAATRRFYERVLNMESREERPGKWSLHFGANKISLQDAGASPAIARDTVPGSGNFCLLTDAPLDAVILHLGREGDCRRTGRTGRSDRQNPVRLLQGSGRQSRRGKQSALAWRPPSRILSHRLQPAADTRFVVAKRVAEAALKICLFARDDAVAQYEEERQG
jgi:catechol 2,3-dioxygenase-like lactoylglutathione lyase family enzyme